jgi:hypothetical protein
MEKPFKHRAFAHFRPWQASQNEPIFQGPEINLPACPVAPASSPAGSGGRLAARLPPAGHVPVQLNPTEPFNQAERLDSRPGSWLRRPRRRVKADVPARVDSSTTTPWPHPVVPLARQPPPLPFAAWPLVSCFRFSLLPTAPFPRFLKRPSADTTAGRTAAPPP